MAPYEAAAVTAARAVADQTAINALAADTLKLSEQQFALTKLTLEAAAKAAGLALWILEHPAPATAYDSKRAYDTMPGVAPAPAPNYDPKRAYDVPPTNTITVGDLHLTVNGGDTSDQTIQTIKNQIGGWFQDAVDRLGKSVPTNMPRNLRGTYAT